MEVNKTGGWKAAGILVAVKASQTNLKAYSRV